MKKPYVILPALLTLCLLVACGGDDSEKSESSSTQAASPSNSTVSVTDYVGGHCGNKVVEDYSALATRYNSIANNDDKKSCRDMANTFLQNYPNIYCATYITSSNQAFTIKAVDIKTLIENLNRTIQ
jgi:hypothetical protein